MFRQLLTYGFTVVALGCGLCVVPVPVHSQDRSTAERLDRLERDLNMLQRQVYRGMPAPPMGAGSGGALVNTEIRMDRLEEQMRNLTGRVEELTNQIAQVRQRTEQVDNGAGMRLGQGADASGPLPSPDVAPSPGLPAAALPSRRFPPPPPDATEEEMPPRLAGPAVPPPGDTVSDGPTPIFGTLSPPGVPPLVQPPPTGHLAPASTASAGRALSGAAPEGSPSAQYNHAFGLLKHADYAGAETALKAFVEQHPNDPMAGNAQYWLGETYYARGRYIDAASAFAEGYKRYPKSGKAADGLLKLGMALGRANQKQNACVVLVRLDHDFPHAGAAVKQHAAAERKHLGC